MTEWFTIYNVPTQPHGSDMFDRSDELNTLPGRGFTGLALAALPTIGAFVIILSSP